MATVRALKMHGGGPTVTSGQPLDPAYSQVPHANLFGDFLCNTFPFHYQALFNPLTTNGWKTHPETWSLSAMSLGDSEQRGGAGGGEQVCPKDANNMAMSRLGFTKARVGTG